MRKIMSYAKVLLYLQNNRISKLGLERIKELLTYLGNPQNKLNIIHVSGTNGKGSFSSMLSSVLYQAGYQVGYFSSPSITTVNDSFRINNRPISDQLFTSIMEKVIEKANNMHDTPTEFELLTAAAFLIFLDSKCNICIIECGLGGDTDSTNIISSPILSVITNIRRDHCDILGNTIEEIAYHKCGIIKENCPVLYGGEINKAFEVIKNKADAMSSKLYITDFNKLHNENFNLDYTEFSYGSYNNLKLSLIGIYQTYNAANVLTAIDILNENGYIINSQSVYNGLKNSSWQGRFEVISQDPIVIFDGAHNPDGINVAIKSIKHYFNGQPVVFLMGIMSDKEYQIYADLVKDIADVIFTVTPNNPRSLDCKKLCDYFRLNNINSVFFEKFDEGVNNSLNYAKSNNLPLVALGSLYMYADFIKAI